MKVMINSSMKNLLKWLTFTWERADSRVVEEVIMSKTGVQINKSGFGIFMRIKKSSLNKYWYLDIRCWFTFLIMKGRHWVCWASKTLTGCRRRWRWRRRWRRSLVNTVLAMTMFYLQRQLQLLLRKWGDGQHVYRCSAVRGGERRDVTTATVLWLIDITVGWVEQVVHAVASEWTAAKRNVKSSFLMTSLYVAAEL